MGGFLGGTNFGFISDSTPQLPSGIITGSVSPSFVPYANGTNTLANTAMTWDAANNRIGINNATPAQALDVTGSIKYSTSLFTPFTAGSVAFIGASGILSQDNATFFWDTTNKRLGIGTTTPSVSLHINSASSPAFRLVDTTQGANSILKSDANGNASWATLSSFNIPIGTGAAGQSTFWTGTNTLSGDNAFFWDNTNKRLGIGTASPSVALHINSGSSPAFRLVDTTQAANSILKSDANGNASWATLASLSVLTGTGTAGQSTFFTGTNTVSGDNAFFWDNTNKRLGIGTASPSVSLHINSGASPAFRLVDGTQGAGKLLQSDANGNATWAALSSIFGSGTTNFVPRFTAATTIGNSTMRDDGSNLGVATVPNVAYTIDVGGTMRVQQSVTLVSTGAFYVGIGIAPSSNGRLNVFANSITGIYITGNSFSQKGIDMNGTILAFETSGGTSSSIQGSGGNMNIKGFNTVNWFPDIATSASTAASISLINDGSGGFKTTLTNVGVMRADGNIYAGQSPFAAGSGTGAIFTVDGATGVQNTNGWLLGNVTTGVVTPDTTRYVRIDIGGTPIKFIIAV